MIKLFDGLKAAYKFFKEASPYPMRQPYIITKSQYRRFESQGVDMTNYRINEPLPTEE